MDFLNVLIIATFNLRKQEQMGSYLTSWIYKYILYEYRYIHIQNAAAYMENYDRFLIKV